MVRSSVVQQVCTYSRQLCHQSIPSTLQPSETWPLFAQAINSGTSPSLWRPSKLLERQPRCVCCVPPSAASIGCLSDDSCKCSYAKPMLVPIPCRCCLELNPNVLPTLAATLVEKMAQCLPFTLVSGLRSCRRELQHRGSNSRQVKG